jgi:hypothetical protein
VPHTKKLTNTSIAVSIQLIELKKLTEQPAPARKQIGFKAAKKA